MSENIVGFNGPLFNYSSHPTDTSPLSIEPEEDTAYDPLAKPSKKKDSAPLVPEAKLEGYKEDPTMSKVVDRRWYERNKHIYPASIWEEFDPEKKYSDAQRKDTSGNAFFFS